MKKIMLPFFIGLLLLSADKDIKAQTIKAGVFDIDLMVQAMTGYGAVDSVVRVYEQDSLDVEFQYYQERYHQLDSIYKIDSGLVAQGKKSKAMLDMTAEDRRKMALNIVYWQQIA